MSFKNILHTDEFHDNALKLVLSNHPLTIYFSCGFFHFRPIQGNSWAWCQATWQASAQEAVASLRVLQEPLCLGLGPHGSRAGSSHDEHISTGGHSKATTGK